MSGFGSFRLARVTREAGHATTVASSSHKHIVTLTRDRTLIADITGVGGWCRVRLAVCGPRGVTAQDRSHPQGNKLDGMTLCYAQS